MDIFNKYIFCESFFLNICLWQTSLHQYKVKKKDLIVYAEPRALAVKYIKLICFRDCMLLLLLTLITIWVLTKYGTACMCLELLALVLTYSCFTHSTMRGISWPPLLTLSSTWTVAIGWSILLLWFHGGTITW